MIKTQNANPVDKGLEKPQQPKATDSEDVGAKEVADNKLAPGTDAAGSVIAEDNKEKPKSDDIHLENKSDDKPDEKKPEEKKV